MIFSEIILHNFGVYKGRHIVDLTPESSNKPIILFGGLNGGGKTTFLDALQLTLYGKFAKCSNRGELSYHDYLKENINRYVSPEEGAAIELEFIYFNEGERTTFRIKRFWKSTGKSIKETIEVLKNGELDRAMSAQWYEYVDEFIPSNISGLFFFDGEQIENLANPVTSGKIIKTGIMSLLGLDIVDKLNIDLQALERRRLAKQLDTKTSAKIHLLEKEIEQLINRCEKESEVLANKTSEIDNLERQISNAKRSYKNHGGELYDQRELIEKQHHHNEQQLKNTEDNIRKFSEGAAPLQLVKELIERAQKQSEKEQYALINRDVIETLEERDLEILNQFVEHSAGNLNVDLLNKLLANDRESRKQSALEKTPLNVRPELLKHFDKTFFSRIQKEAHQLRESYEYLSDELATSDRKLSAIPEADMIKQVAHQLKATEDSSKKAQGEQIVLQNLYNETAKTTNNKQIELDRLLHRENDEQLNTHRNKNIIEHTREVRHTLDLYHKALIEKHIGRLETLIKESFTTLIRKKDLIHNIKISPDDFSLSVVSKQNEIIPTKRLSAGERQLLAISILWGLAKASGRPLPAIIDTPLGRLDSEHRGHLIDNYFPNASHQVILLSTDTEIDNEYRNALSHRIGKEYHIQYHEDQHTSTITPGYF
jgi:DNA sulfur modification protein DndD